MEKTEDQQSSIEQRLRAANLRAIDFIKERPATCLLAALAAGYLIGRIRRPRH